jgi:hypothetical protein
MKCVPLRDISKRHSEQPPVRTTAVYVPYEIDLPYLGILVVTDHGLQRGLLVDGPDSGHYQIGDIVGYSYLPGFDLPVVTAGCGPF